MLIIYLYSFGDNFLYQHAMKAPDEMKELHKQFYAYMKRMKKCGCKTKNKIWSSDMKMKNIKNCQLKNLQKQQEDMKVAMLVFTKCARKIIRIFWKN